MSDRTTHLLYLHGFRSSPQSTKAQLIQAAVLQRHPEVIWCAPQLPPSPRLAMEQVSGLIAGWPGHSMGVVGSSLGGFYASWVARQTGCRTVLLNPAVDPARDLARHIGKYQLWHHPGESFDFKDEYVDQLKQMRLEGPLSPGPELAIIAKGDEVLDWREMSLRYVSARQIVLPGGDHAISDFDQHLDEVLKFLNLD